MMEPANIDPGQKRNNDNLYFTDSIVDCAFVLFLDHLLVLHILHILYKCFRLVINAYKRREKLLTVMIFFGR